MRDARAKRPRGRRPLRFQDLMRRRVRRVLLVSSLYDSFILAEDGQVSEAIATPFVDLTLSIGPDITRVSTGGEALDALAEDRFDLVVTSLHVGDMDCLELARRIQAAEIGVPVVLLAYSNRELTDFRSGRDLSPIEGVFLWQGDVRILVAIVKQIEDRLNVEHDTGTAGVPAILVVEDNVRFYSSFLPVIYTELVKHSERLMAEGLNFHQRMLRMRARPKILLCETYERAWSWFDRYQAHVLGVISDIEFPWRGEPHRTAGVELVSRMRRVRFDVPVMLQSSFPENEELARSVGAAFLLKGSPLLLHQLRKFIVEHFGFGPFVFQSPDGVEIDRAPDLATLIEKLETVPAESIAFHGAQNHFSNWLMARGELELAESLRPRKISDWPSIEALRQDLIRSIGVYRRTRDRVVVADFQHGRIDTASSMWRIGGGSLGGKARSMAFVNRLLAEYGTAEKFPGVTIRVPASVVLATDVFDEFLDRNDLRGLALGGGPDREITEAFERATFPDVLLDDLRRFLATATYPLAVRSSGLLEDSPNQPVAGVYQTYMLPNQGPDLELRLAGLVSAVRRVYLSTFSREAKGHLAMTPFRLEEEKMAVILQEIVGRAHGSRFYPDFAGVGRSHNFYPTPPLLAADGIVAVALGLGKTVVEGGCCVRFSPAEPLRVPLLASPHEALRDSQREFWALDLEEAASDENEGLQSYGLDVAERDGTLASLGSTYSPEDDILYDGVGRPGIRIVSFAPILKHGLFPLAELLNELLDIGREGTSSEVEIEFAANLAGPGGGAEFGFLQMRPLALSSEPEELRIGHVLSSRLVCRSATVLGNGKLDMIRDLVVVEPQTFDRNRSREVAREVARWNARLQAEGAPYVLIGVGRWGSADRHLGIPVSWNQIAGARVIVEAGFRDIRVTPSQGTHFFQNLTSCNVGYFTVNPEAGDGFIDWEWLAAQPESERSELVRHVRLDRPMSITMSGKTGQGVILKPEGA